MQADRVVRGVISLLSEELWEKRGQSSPTFQSAKPGESGFAGDTVKTTGIAKRTINQSIARAKAIPADIRDTIKGTKLDTGTYLDSLKGMEPVRAPDTARSPLRAAVPPEKPRPDSGDRYGRRLCAASRCGQAG